MDNLKIRLSTYQTFAVVELEGVLNVSNLIRFTSKIREILEQGITALVFDFEKLEYIDSSGIGTIVNLHRKIRCVAIYNLVDHNRETFDRMGLFKIMKLYDTVEDFYKDLDNLDL